MNIMSMNIKSIKCYIVFLMLYTSALLHLIHGSERILIPSCKALMWFLLMVCMIVQQPPAFKLFAVALEKKSVHTCTLCLVFYNGISKAF